MLFQNPLPVFSLEITDHGGFTGLAQPMAMLCATESQSLWDEPAMALSHCPCGPQGLCCNVSWDKAMTDLWDGCWMSQVLISHVRFAPKYRQAQWISVAVWKFLCCSLLEQCGSAPSARENILFLKPLSSKADEKRSS